MQFLYPAIVVVAYNRSHSLQRLLNSIRNASYEGVSDVQLVISIDGGDNSECVRVAEQFEWNFGQKRVIVHEQNMGLKHHVIACGDLSMQYGAIIMLEDDLIVSPFFYQYTVQTATFYADDPRIAEVSLYTYRHSEEPATPFLPLRNDADVFFAQVPSSWGQCWTAQQWERFRAYFAQNDNTALSDLLPPNVKEWPTSSSWKKYFYSYIIEHDLYVVYPYQAYTTNMGDAGVHCPDTTEYQVPLVLFKPTIKLVPYDDTTAIVYDVYLEISPNVIKSFGVLTEFDFDVDLSGKKPLSACRCPYIISTKECIKPLFSFGLQLLPIETNVILNNVGTVIHFGKREDFSDQTDRMLVFRLYHEKTYNVVYSVASYQGAQMAIQAMKQTKKYRLGDFLLRPWRWIYKFVSNKKNND